MTSLVLASVFFVGIHLFVAGTPLRDTLVSKLGEPAYLGLFSLASLVGIVWMSSAYAAAPVSVLWGTPVALKPLAAVTMAIALFFAVVGITTPSPTAMGGEARLAAGEIGGMLRITRHPFLWGAAIWALTHLVMNGDVASLVFFGAFAGLTLAGTASIDAKRARKSGEAWTAFARATSNVPFGAIASGHNHLAIGELGLWRIALAIAVYVALFVYHGAIFGVSAT